MKVVIINYGAGNIKSIQFAFNRLGLDAVLSHNPEEILAADKIIFPGVGEASTAMEKLTQSGLISLIPQFKTTRFRYLFRNATVMQCNGRRTH